MPEAPQGPKVYKKASPEAIAYAQTCTERKLGLSTSWEACWDIICGLNYYEVRSGLETTTIRILGEPGSKEPLYEWEVPTTSVFDDSVGDWYWPALSKFLVESWMEVNKPKKKRKTTKKKTQK